MFVCADEMSWRKNFYSRHPDKGKQAGQHFFCTPTDILTLLQLPVYPTKRRVKYTEKE